MYSAGTTQFKKLCRAHGIKRWPYRKFKTLRTTSKMLAKVSTSQDAEKAKQVMLHLRTLLGKVYYEDDRL